MGEQAGNSNRVRHVEGQIRAGFLPVLPVVEALLSHHQKAAISGLDRKSDCCALCVPLWEYDWNAGYYYDIHTMDGRKASDCVKCGKCEHVCPQHLPIRKLLQDVAKEFEK